VDDIQFDALTRAIGFQITRRQTVSALLGGALGLLGLTETAAKKKKGKGKNKKNKKKDSSRPALTPPTGPVLRADAACLGTVSSGSSANGNARYAQTFTAIASGPLVSAQFQIGKAEDTIGDYILRLSAVTAGGVPTNTVLASALVPDGDVPAAVTMVNFTFPTPFSVVAGVRYALVVTRPGSTILGAHGHANDTCAGGAFFSNDQDDAFAASAGTADFIFATFVSS
jgi:hypothetical protein